jgi:hypothetical protein
MIKIMQTKVDNKTGDCLRACVASMFELEIEAVPNFLLFKKRRWFQMMWYYFKGLQCDIVYCYKPQEISNKYLLNGCILAVVKSLNGSNSHAILIDSVGNVLHDPSPNKSYNGTNVIKSGALKHWIKITPWKDCSYA